MKYLMLAAFMLFAGSHLEGDGDYESLWKKVRKSERTNPKTAYKTVEEIYDLSIKEQRDDQLVKAILYKEKLSAQFEDIDLGDRIKRTEKELSKISSNSVKAVYASILGKLHHQYGMYNSHRFDSRTEIEGGGSEGDLPFASLTEVQNKAVGFYKQSLSYPLDKDLAHMEILLEEVREGRNVLSGKTLAEVLLFNAINHFKDSRSLVSLPVNPYSLNDTKLFDFDYSLGQVDLDAIPASEYSQLAMALFDIAGNLDYESSEDRIIVELNRLEYLNSHARVADKDALYRSALQKLGDRYKGQLGFEAPYILLAGICIQEGDRVKYDHTLKNTNGYEKAADILRKIKAGNPSKKYSKEITNLEKKINQKELGLELERVYVPEENILGKLDYRNLKEAEVTLYRLSAAQFEEFLNFHNSYEKVAKSLSQYKLVSSRDVKLPAASDYGHHSTEFATKGLPLGNYLMIADTGQKSKGSKDGKAMVYFHVSNLSHVFSSSTRNSVGYIVDRTSGQPLENVQVEIYRNQYNRKIRRAENILAESRASDKNGRVDLNGIQGNYRLKLIKGEDELFLYETHYGHGEYSEDYANQLQVQLFTDRAIYRPGQTVYFKGLAVEMDRENLPKIAASQNLSVIFRDANWQEIHKQEFVTDEFGTFHGEVTTPEGVLTGQMQFEIQMGNTFYHSIRVEEYKRPKVYAVMDTLTDTYVLGDTVSITGSVKSFSGSVPENSAVTYKVEKRRHIRYWCGDFRYYPGQRSADEIIKYGTTQTDETGAFELNFDTKPSGSEFYSHIYIVTADVTEASGETATVTKSIMLSDKPFTLDIVMPEKAFLGELDNITVNAINTEQKNIVAAIAMKVYELEHPKTMKRQRYWKAIDQVSINEKDFESKFPKDRANAFGEIDSWKVGKEVLSSSEVIAGERIGALNKLGQGAYKIEFSAKDADGSEINETRYLQLSDKSGRALPTEALWYSEPNDSYEPGEKLELTVASAYAEASLLYRIHSNKKEIKSDWLQLPKDKVLRYTISEKDRGGFTVEFMLVKDNRVYPAIAQVKVPWTNKHLEIKYASFRDKVAPGDVEEWSLNIKGLENSNEKALLTAALYDVSLDQFVKHKWSRTFFPTGFAYDNFRPAAYTSSHTRALNSTRLNYHYSLPRLGPNFKYFEIGYRGGRHMRRGMAEEQMMSAPAGAPAPMSKSAGANDLNLDSATISEDEDVAWNDSADGIDPEQNAKSKSEVDNFGLRENLDETVFFFPELPVVDGKAEIKFTMNEALTKWKLLLFAHNKEMQFVFDEKEIISQKPLMIEPQLPRFVRQGDAIILTSKVTNFSDKTIEALCELTVSDSETKDALSNLISSQSSQTVSVSPGQTEIVKWEVNLNDDQINPLDLVVTVEGGGYKDGERNLIPVLSNRMQITETLPMHLSGGETKTFGFNIPEASGVGSYIVNQKFVVEFTSNPAWMMVKTLPAMEETNESTTGIFNNLYSTLLVSDLLGQNPPLKEEIRSWKEADMKSELSKKEDLKLSTLKETPWVRAALSEEDQMRRLKTYLNDNQVNDKISRLKNKLSQRQGSSGGFSWMNGGRPNWHITQSIVEGLGRLRTLGIDTEMDAILKSAVMFCDEEIVDHYEDHKKNKDKYLPAIVIHYLYMRSMYPEMPTSAKSDKVIAHYFKLAEKRWPEVNSYQQALIALAAQKKNGDLTNSIISSLKERMISSQELGNYWNDQAGYYWHNNNIEQQAVLIELFEKTNQEQKSIDGMKLWLLKNKQTNGWATSKATASAAYAFLLDNKDMKGPTEPVSFKFPLVKHPENFEISSGKLGYIKLEIPGDQIGKGYGQMEVTNPNGGVAWGASYYQYFNDLNKIRHYEETPTKLSKQVYKVSMTDNGEVLKTLSPDETIAPGDKLRIRISLQVDRHMEFIEMKDMRSSGLEPVNVLSHYKWQDGLGYYESTKDLATYFFFDDLPKGNYVFEYDLRAVHQGVFSNGITQIQSVYAPEFASHSDGVSLSITK